VKAIAIFLRWDSLTAEEQNILLTAAHITAPTPIAWEDFDHWQQNVLYGLDWYRILGYQAPREPGAGDPAAGRQRP